LPVTKLKQNINRVYIVSLGEYISSRIQIPPHPIYYKKIEIPPIHHILYITKRIPKPVWPVSQTGLTGLALWAVVKCF
jgi:hypothetical protein